MKKLKKGRLFVWKVDQEPIQIEVISRFKQVNCFLELKYSGLRPQGSRAQVLASSIESTLEPLLVFSFTFSLSSRSVSSLRTAGQVGQVTILVEGMFKYTSIQSKVIYGISLLIGTLALSSGDGKNHILVV